MQHVGFSRLSPKLPTRYTLNTPTHKLHHSFVTKSLRYTLLSLTGVSTPHYRVVQVYTSSDSLWLKLFVHRVIRYPITTLNQESRGAEDALETSSNKLRKQPTLVAFPMPAVVCITGVLPYALIMQLKSSQFCGFEVNGNLKSSTIPPPPNGERYRIVHKDLNVIIITHAECLLMEWKLQELIHPILRNPIGI